MITLKVHNVHSYIVGDLQPYHIKGLEERLRFRPQGYQFSPKFNLKFFACSECNKKTIHPFCRSCNNADCKYLYRAWDGWKKLFWHNKKQTYYPTGLTSIVKEYFDDNNIELRTCDLRIKPEKNINLEYSGLIDYRDYQKLIINNAALKGRGIIHAATGAGKTIIATGIMKEIAVAPIIFYVTSVDLLTQAKNSFEEVLLQDGKPLKVGQIGGGVIDIRDVNVMTIQTAVRALGKTWNSETKYDSDDSDDKTPIGERKEEIQELIHTAKLSFSDEVQHWRSSTCQDVAKELKEAYYTFGMSATPYRDEGDDLMIQACFGKKLASVTASKLIKDNWLIKPEIKMIHIHNKKSKYKSWQKIYKDQISENEEYNQMVAKIANAYIERGRLVLVLVNQIKHGKEVASMINNSMFLSGASSKKKREEGIKSLRNRYISCIVSTVIFDEGIDIKPLDTVILAGQGKCLSESTYINSDLGLLTLGEISETLPVRPKEDSFIKADIKVDSMRGEVKSTHWYNGGKQKCLELVAQNGIKIIGTFNHRLRVLTTAGFKYKKMKDITNDDYLAIKKNNLMFSNLRPDVTPNLARLIAYCLTEGCMTNDRYFEISNIFDGDHKHFIDFEKEFNIPFVKHPSNRGGPDKLKEGWIYRCCRKQFLLKLRGLGVEKVTSRYKTIPLSIRQSNYESTVSFISAVFDAEGSVNRFGIEITMGAEQFIRTLQIMLLNFGINSRLDEKLIKNKLYWRLKIEDQENLRKFQQSINFCSKNKRDKLKLICKRKYNPNTNVIPGLKNICNKIRKDSKVKHSAKEYKKATFMSKLSPSSKQEFTHDSLHQFLEFYHDVDNWHSRYLRYLCNKDYEFIPIVNVKETKPQQVYDITVPSHHYIANSTISHNSKTRAMQRIGRIIRPFPNKAKATAIDFMVHQKFLKEHAIERLKMYQTEPEFSIEEIDLKVL